MATLNANPTVYHARETNAAALRRRRHAHMRQEEEAEDEAAVEPWTAEEVFELIRHINDPEHPLTLEQLRVAQLEHVQVVDALGGADAHAASSIDIRFTPTIPHCSLATLIGLCLRVKLLRSLPRRFKVQVSIAQGAHASEVDINKQLADKERVAAALENHTLLDLVNKCIRAADDEPPTMQQPQRTGPAPAT